MLFEIYKKLIKKSSWIIKLAIIGFFLLLIASLFLIYTIKHDESRRKKMEQQQKSSSQSQADKRPPLSSFYVEGARTACYSDHEINKFLDEQTRPKQHYESPYFFENSIVSGLFVLIFWLGVIFIIPLVVFFCKKALIKIVYEVTFAIAKAIEDGKHKTEYLK